MLFKLLTRIANISSTQSNNDSTIINNTERRNDNSPKVISYSLNSAKKSEYEYGTEQFKVYTSFTLPNVDGSLYTFVILFKSETKNKDKISAYLKGALANHLKPDELLAGMILFFNCSNIGFKTMYEQKTLFIFV